MLFVGKGRKMLQNVNRFATGIPWKSAKLGLICAFEQNGLFPFLKTNALSSAAFIRRTKHQAGYFINRHHEFNHSGKESSLQTGKNGHERRYFTQAPKTLTSEIIKRAPALAPYLNLIRFDKPIGTWLLFIPCTWSISMASDAGSLPNLKMLALFGAGSILLRSAGCIINDMWDSDFDRKVARTKTRPLAAKDINHTQALAYLGGILSCGLMILLSLNWYSIFLGASAMLPVVAYPLMKRYTYWPQLFLGLTFNWGALLGWSAVKGSCDWSVVMPVYLAGVSWTMMYDTIYAHQDKADDILIGVKSTALLFRDKTVPWLGLFSTSMVTFLLTSGYMADQTWPFYAAVGGIAGHLAWQILTVDLDNTKDCAAKFKSNKWLGLLLFSGIIAGNLIKTEDQEKD